MSDVPAASSELLEAALDIARTAGDMTLKWFQSSTLAVETKGDGSPVTEADKTAERYIRERIEELAPDSSIVGEEEGSSVGSSALTWYIDPIDGTIGFTRGVPLYSTLLAVDDEYGPAVGVIHIPATGETVWAGRGLGAFSNHGAARVSDVSQLQGACITTSSVSRWGADMFGRVHAAKMDVRGWGDGYGYLMVATGRLDAMADINGGKPWDFAPLPVIMSEAGGRLSDLSGEVNINSPSILATNGFVHEELLSVLNG